MHPAFCYGAHMLRRIRQVHPSRLRLSLLFGGAGADAFAAPFARQ